MPPFSLPEMAVSDLAQLASRGLHLERREGGSISSTVINGFDPTTYSPSHASRFSLPSSLTLHPLEPITLFIIQLIIIIVFTQIIGYGFRYIKQPAVIAEVIGGIILGPTVMGRIPNFTQHIFPAPSVSYLNLVANVGLILFLFLIGVEVDVAVMKRNGRAAAIVSITGMIIPFGLGAACAVPTYNNFVDRDNVSFGHFMLFIGVAMAITAFPVLCRILTSTKLLDTRVGMIVLAAGVGNDVVGWVLLALTLALVNGGGGATAAYMLLAAVGWTILLLWPIRRVFKWACRRTGSLDGKGPTLFMMNLTLLIVFTSAFVTGILGVHPIFGAFIAGLIVPHEGGFAISLVEKIDDLVSMLFLPIYFVLSGLSTNLGLLDNGKDWGYIIMFCVIGWFGKFAGCAVSAWLLGYTYRESGAIGMLMSCKGLVELIVLNVGYQAGVIDQRLFSMLVVVAVVLTFITTPFTVWIYPEKYRVRGDGVPRPLFGKDRERRTTGLQAGIAGPGGREITERFLVVLQKIEHLSAVMFLSQLLEPSTKLSRSPVAPEKAIIKAAAGTVKGGGEGDSDQELHSSPSRHSSAPPGATDEENLTIKMDALKLIELTGRTFSVMQSAEKDQMLLSDDALQLFKQYGRLRGFEITPHIDIVGADAYSSAVAEKAQHQGSELVIVPWTIPDAANTETLLSGRSVTTPSVTPAAAGSSSVAASPVNSIFGPDVHSQASPFYTDFIRRVFGVVSADVALFVDRGFGAAANFVPGAGQHIFMPFFGGADDRLALRFVVQLCANQHVSATVVRIQKEDDAGSRDSDVKPEADGPSPTPTSPGAVDTAVWEHYTLDKHASLRPPALNAGLGRIVFHSLKAAAPLVTALDNCETTARAAEGHHMWRPLLVVTGRGLTAREGESSGSGARGGGSGSRADERAEEARALLAARGLDVTAAADLRRTVGDVAAAVVLSGGRAAAASFLVLESGEGKSAAQS